MTSVEPHVRIPILLADKSVFDVALRSKMGITFIDTIAQGVAPITSTLGIIDLVERQTDRLHPPVNAIWRENLSEMRRHYVRILSTKNDFPAAVEEVGLIAGEVTRGINHFNSKVDGSEIELLAAASWLRRNTAIEPFVASDDRDVLRACHLISSFFGLAISILSTYELVRLASGRVLIGDFCDHFSIGQPISHFDGRLHLAPGLVEEVDRFARKGFLSMHFLLPSNRTTTGLTTKIKPR